MERINNNVKTIVVNHAMERVEKYIMQTIVKVKKMKKSGHTINKGSEQVDSRHTLEIKESENENITGVNEDPETPLKDIEINLDPRDDCDQNSSSNLKTKHNAACISKIVGISEKVLKFDVLRYQLKHRKNPVTQKQEHNKLLAELQVLIQSKKSNIMEQIKQTEAAYFQTHATIPTDEACPERMELMKKVKLANKLLATWNIQLYM